MSFGGFSFGPDIFGSSSDSGNAGDMVYGPNDIPGGVAPIGPFPDPADTAKPGSVVLNPTTPSSTGSWVTTLINDGMKVMNSALGYQLQQQQIAKGQIPSIGYDPTTGAPTGQSVASFLAALKSGQIAGAISSSAWLYIIIGAVVLIMVMRK